MKKITFYLLLFMICFQGFSQQRSRIEVNSNLSQPTNSSQEQGFVRCAADEYNERLLQQYPKMMGSEYFEQFIAQKIAEHKAEQETRNADDTNVVVTIPVVVHVLHNGEPIGTAPNITDAQVQSQIDVMNIDYRNLAGSTQAAAADVELEFCLAQQDPSGNPTTGINRVDIGQDGILEFSLSDAQNQMDALKPSSVWDRTYYMNMWTVKYRGGSGLLGYAQFPGGPANTDGVVSDYKYFGSSDYDDGSFILSAPFDKGRTMTHEVGHYFGLYHPFQGGCAQTGGGDFCDDTPPVATANSNSSVCTPNDSCSEFPNLPDMIENYMDYSTDSCMDTFTNDQKARVIAALADATRVGLTTSNRCNPAVPTINFGSSTSPGTINEGSDCAYQDFTINLEITQGASASATATLSNAGTATEGADFDLLNNSVTFSAGSTTPSNSITLRVYEDALVEMDETIILSIGVTTSGDALADTLLYQLTVTNDDDTITGASSVAIFSDDFSDGDFSDWTTFDNDGVADNDWDIFQESNWTTPFGIYTDYFMGSYSWNGDPYNPDNFLVSPLITIPAGATTVNLRYFAGSGSDATFFNENYEVYISSSNASVAAIQLGTLLVDTVLPAQGGQFYDVDISAFAHPTVDQDIYISFRHHDTYNEWILGIDDVSVSVDSDTNIQTTVNSGSPDMFGVNESGTAFSTDSTSGDLMLSIDNTGGFDYGCTAVSVSRDQAGVGAYSTMYGTVSGTSNYVTSKVFTVTTDNSGSSNSTMDFYFTEAEIAGWESETGNSRANLYVKNAGTDEVVSATVTTFGTDVKVSGNFTMGLAGTYYFGTQSPLNLADVSLDTLLSIYPNPTSDVVTIKVASNSLPDGYKIYNMLGQLVREDEINNQSDLTFDVSTFSNGMYFVKISQGNQSATIPLVKK